MTKTKKHEYQGAAALLLTAFLWGTTFVFQRTGMDHIGPLTFNMMRNLLSALFLGALWIILRAAAGKSILSPEGGGKAALIGGLVCGACLGLGMGLQQVGLKYTTVGKTSFISALYIVIVPLIRMAAGRKYRKGIWLCVFLALAGLFMLTVSGDAIIRLGDVLVFFSAVVFSFHILVINHYTKRVPGVLLSFLQMIVAAVLSLIGVLVFKEAPTLAGITQAGGSLLYAGILSGGVAFTLQIIAQKHVEPVVASLIMCFEAVFGALGGWVILHERLSVREWTGCALMFAAILLVQWMTNDETRPVVSG